MLFCYPVDLVYRASRTLSFSRGGLANRIRGGLGKILKDSFCVPSCQDARFCPARQTCAYAQLFEPSATNGPSGFRDPPRPFVLRVRPAEGTTTEPGETFRFGFHLFHRNPQMLEACIDAFARLGTAWLGPAPGAATLLSASLYRGEERAVLFDGRRLQTPPPPRAIPCDIPAVPVNALWVQFCSPTDLKGDEFTAETPLFSTLLARARDRVSTLAALYGTGPPSVDFAALGDRARHVRCIRANLSLETRHRTSARTRQKHGLGGLVGEAVYEGELTEFVPWLRAAEYTGIGRHAAWGNGEIHITCEAQRTR